MKRFALSLFITLISSGLTLANNGKANEDTLSGKTILVKVDYLERVPFFYTENNNQKGIEKEILDEFVKWAKAEKNVNLQLNYKQHTEFSSLLDQAKSETENYIGAGTITINQDRQDAFHFSGPYLRNISVLVSAGKVSNINEYAKKAAFTKNSVHQSYIQELQANTQLSLENVMIDDQTELPNIILKDSSIIGYMDLINYWSFVKHNPDKYLRIHRSQNKTNESFGFVTQKQSLVGTLLDEFFNSGFGFTSTKAYHAILERYLGYEVMGAVEVNNWK